MKKLIFTIYLLCFAFSASAEDITNKYMNNFNSYLSKTLGKIFPTTEVSLSSGVTNEVTGSILVVKPLSNDEDNIFFSQMSLFFSDDSRETINLGIGKRKLLIDDKLLIGANLFFDNEVSYSHRRTSLGIEAISSVGYLRANQYYALSGWKSGLGGIEERALSGNDIELGAPLPYLPWTSVNFRSFKWIGVESVEDQEGDEMSLEAKLPYGITVEGGKRSHDGTTEDAQFVELTWSCCKEEEQKFGINDKAYNLTSVANQKFAKVKRQNLIIKQKRMDLSVIGF
ncbi:inverse autotransporter beta domain-containing protein [Pelagibacterales bacterium SAG-MED46]|nr:inverse autotransporter beta domain-containing protein [Pelagibacterales bacterium SAG-MED46]